MFLGFILTVIFSLLVSIYYFYDDRHDYDFYNSVCCFFYLFYFLRFYFVPTYLFEYDYTPDFYLISLISSYILFFSIFFPCNFDDEECQKRKYDSFSFCFFIYFVFNNIFSFNLSLFYYLIFIFIIYFFIFFSYNKIEKNFYVRFYNIPSCLKYKF